MPFRGAVWEPGLRFAFYGRMSTSIFQDAQTSRAWQRAISDELIEGVGSVVGLARARHAVCGRSWARLGRETG